MPIRSAALAAGLIGIASTRWLSGAEERGRWSKLSTVVVGGSFGANLLFFLFLAGAAAAAGARWDERNSADCLWCGALLEDAKIEEEDWYPIMSSAMPSTSSSGPLFFVARSKKLSSFLRSIA